MLFNAVLNKETCFIDRMRMSQLSIVLKKFSQIHLGVIKLNKKDRYFDILDHCSLAVDMK